MTHPYVKLTTSTCKVTYLKKYSCSQTHFTQAINVDGESSLSQQIKMTSQHNNKKTRFQLRMLVYTLFLKEVFSIYEPNGGMCIMQYKERSIL